MIAAAGPSPLWYLTRGSGVVVLILLTASVILGMLQVLRWAPRRSPRFMIVGLHRAISLLVLIFLAAHVGAAVLDPFAPIRLVDAVLPFTGSYRPLWLGLGAVALDLLVALTVTSVLRRRLGLATWRAVHRLAYACWPIALVHGLGTGSDARTLWMLVLSIGCVATVLLALAWRLADGWPASAGVRGTAIGTAVAVTAAGALWFVQGPLAEGWARRAGTPTKLLAPAAATARRRAATVHEARSPVALAAPFTSEMRGSVRRGLSAGGSAVVDLRMRLTGDVPGTLRLQFAGDPAQGGGVLMRRSAVSLGPPSAPNEYRGRVVSLRGSSLQALVGSRAGRALRLAVDLAISQAEATGTISAVRASDVGATP